MPIVGITDRKISRFSVIGKLRKGAKADGNIGRDLDYFRFTSDNEEIVAAFEKAYGKTPKSLEVYLAFASVEETFATWAEEWNRTGLLHRCDGQRMVRWLDNGNYVEGSKACPYHTGEKQRSRSNPGCKPIGRLTVILPKLVQAGYVGYVVVETHSKHDMYHIQEVLEATKDAALNRANGLQGILFTLYRQPQEITMRADDGSRKKVKKNLIKIAPSAQWVALQIESAARLALTANVPTLALTDGRTVDGGTGEIVSSAWEEEEEDEESPLSTEEEREAMLNKLATLPEPFNDLKAFARAMKTTYKIGKAVELTSAQVTEIVAKLGIIGSVNLADVSGFGHPVELSLDFLTALQSQETKVVSNAEGG